MIGELGVNPIVRTKFFILLDAIERAGNQEKGERNYEKENIGEAYLEIRG